MSSLSGPVILAQPPDKHFFVRLDDVMSSDGCLSPEIR